MFRLSLAVESGGYSLDVVCGLLTAVASLVGEHGLSCSAASGDLPRPGIELVSPVLADVTTGPPGKSPCCLSNCTH